MRNRLVLAVSLAIVFGLLEGALLLITRPFPVILAPYKTSPAIIWAAPLVYILCFLPLTFLLQLVARAARQWARPDSLVTFGLAFVGFTGVLMTTRVLYSAAALLLSLGLAVVLVRKLTGSEDRFARFLNTRILTLALVIPALMLVVWGYGFAREAWIAARLAEPPSGAPNVLFLVMDTVRHENTWEAEPDKVMPNLRRITADAVHYENAWATSSWSLPSHASILTGRYPEEHKADWPQLRLDESTPTIAEYLQKHGYVTGAFSGNSAWVTPEYLGRGFLRFDAYGFSNLLGRTFYGRVLSRGLSSVGFHYSGFGRKAPLLNKEFLDLIDGYRDRPFFAYLCYMDVNQDMHSRWFNTSFLREAPMDQVFDAYRRGLTTLDRHLGELWTELERRDLLKNTLVVITSDHGQSFGRGVTAYEHEVGHGTTLYPEQLRVPLYVIFPGRSAPDKPESGNVSLRAVSGLVTDFLALPGSRFSGSVPGETLSPDHEVPVLATLNYGDRALRSVIWRHWQYIKDSQNHQEELYDLATDPKARVNLAGTKGNLRQFKESLQYPISHASAISHIR